MKIFFTVPGVPIAKGRVRSRVIPGKNGKKAFATHYADPKSANFENKVTTFFYENYQDIPLQGALSVSIRAYFAIPKSWSKKKKYNAQTVDMPVVKRPDIDNVAKSVLDGLNTVAFEDDKQVAELFCSKYYSENPRTEITIEWDEIRNPINN